MTTRESANPAIDILSTQQIHQQIGTLTRQLHDSLAGLGLASKVKEWAGELPDAKSRLSYIARLTGEAADKVLNQVDQAKEHHDFLARETERIRQLLDQGAAAPDIAELKKFVSSVDDVNQKIDASLTEIMMAQDFHDLTGQVIAKVVNLAASIEEQLVTLLIQTAPLEHALRTSAPPPAHAPNTPTLSGPVVSNQNSPEVVTNQEQVDDLLSSLGF